MVWDVFCRVIDNFGDIGVCWRLCADLARRGHSLRLWVDDSSPLDWMAPGARQGQWPGVRVLDWQQAGEPALRTSFPPADVWIEAFGCEIATEFIAESAYSAGRNAQNPLKKPVWINLEYLSAEAYVERCHGLPSPVMQGPAKGAVKHFYYPGFSAGTGGLLREPDLSAEPTEWTEPERRRWLQNHGVAWGGERLVSLFCYEPAALQQALTAWARAPAPTLLLVTPGRAARAVEAALCDAGLQGSGAGQEPIEAGASRERGSLRVHYLPPLPQPDFDALLHCCDLNFVRGEDSLVRALWAGKPFVWHIYPQDDGAHASKLTAFLDEMQADATVRALHAAWNGLPAGRLSPSEQWDQLALEAWQSQWQVQVQAWRARLWRQPDLATALIGFVSKRR